MSIHDRLSNPDEKRRYVRTLFDTIADRYDLITVVLSYGRDRVWKRRLVQMASPVRGMRALDLATGTGDIAFAIHERGVGVMALDITARMIQLARARRPAGGPAFVVGDMQALPFPAASFDLLTTGYGLRNVSDLPAALDEMLRVLKPGGRAFSLDFNRPRNPVVRGAYLLYLTLVGGALGWLLHRDPDTYRYIPASIRRYPGAEAVAELMETRGFVEVRHHRLLGGLMAIHQGSRP